MSPLVALRAVFVLVVVSNCRVAPSQPDAPQPSAPTGVAGSGTPRRAPDDPGASISGEDARLVSLVTEAIARRESLGWFRSRSGLVVKSSGPGLWTSLGDGRGNVTIDLRKNQDRELLESASIHFSPSWASAFTLDRATAMWGPHTSGREGKRASVTFRTTVAGRRMVIATFLSTPRILVDAPVTLVHVDREADVQEKRPPFESTSEKSDPIGN